MEYKVGNAYYLYDDRAEHDVCKAHILAILPHPEDNAGRDKTDKLIVYRWYGKHKRYWFYGVTTYWQQTMWADYVKSKVEKFIKRTARH